LDLVTESHQNLLAAVGIDLHSTVHPLDFVSGSPYGADQEVGSMEFDGELWLWDARQVDSWTFVSVPPELSEEIRDRAAARPPAGFGSVRVAVSIGSSSWQTSVFPGADGRYALPVKKAVRRKEGVEAGDQVRVRLDVLDADTEP
jgi:hypothetical protein